MAGTSPMKAGLNARLPAVSVLDSPDERGDGQSQGSAGEPRGDDGVTFRLANIEAAPGPAEPPDQEHPRWQNG
jgi:hypothetical protein